MPGARRRRACQFEGIDCIVGLDGRCGIAQEARRLIQKLKRPRDHTNEPPAAGSPNFV